MNAVTVEELYHAYIEPIPVADQLRLIALMSQHLARTTATSAHPKTRRLLELEGLGAELWNGVDAQEYVNALRAEWENPA